jgi:F0F1-type ATP synthase assembly protein I
MPPQTKKRIEIGPLRAGIFALQFGFVVGTFVLGGIWMGNYLDDRFGTAPLLVIVGMLVGLLLSFGAIYQLFRLQT